jgi:hypothetical protein
MKKAITAVCAAWLTMTTTGIAQSSNGVVVELFTSQGCSSCPSADALLAKLSADPRLIPLSLHVDYWDYLGWKDKFGSPQFTARQKAYAHFARDKMVYTPQVIVQGEHRMIGSKAAEVTAAIQAELDQVRPTQITLDRVGDTVIVQASAVGAGYGAIRVQLVRFSAVENVVIERGENAGKTIAYHNVVKNWQVVGTWDGKGALNIEVPATGPAPLAVILQSEGPGEILAAATWR